MANALPRVVLAPIFTLWLGLGIWSKVALGVTLVFFIVFFNVYQGVKEVSPTVLANARMLGMSEQQLMRHVYWPSALSWMFSSLHTSVGFAVVGAVVGEYLGSAAGLGYLIQQAEGVFDVAGVFAGMFVLAAFVIVIDTLVSMVEKRLVGLAAGDERSRSLGRRPLGAAELLRLDAGRLDDRPPLVDLGLLEFAQGLRRCSSSGKISCARSISFLRVDGLASALRSAPLSLAMISFGVPLGAHSACQKVK